ncbi:MAG: tRNA uridine(34) 5-carboxymethylaminomethyl modification radical SAM/GNAT enzyme Elp3 [Patescibacteria group bacterium]
MEKKILKKFIKALIRKKSVSLPQLLQLKRKFAKEYRERLFSNITLLDAYRQMVKKGEIPARGGSASGRKRIERVEKLLKRREIRTLSGVSIITVLTKPYPCPGKCLYCPDEKGMPKSYLKNEPAAQRAFLNNFDPYKQVKMRLEALSKTGHPTDKIEMIVLGGSWTAYPEKYKTWFIKRLFEAGNGRPASDLTASQKSNERARHRIIGLSVETRPDLVTEKEAEKMRELGVTRVELGIQSIYSEVLKKINRGSSLDDTIKATKILKDFGFKVVYHLMPNLPGSTPIKDLRIFKVIFSDERFQPDMLKIYPCVVLKTAPLYKIYKQGKYKPYSQKVLNKLLINVKKIIPPYVRINRLIRDIPGGSIIAGNKITNLRQLLQNQNVKCRCIRCREARGKIINEKDLILIKREYKASEGTEYFLSFETRDRRTLYAFLRLRLPNICPAQAETPALLSEKTMRVSAPALSPETALIRELHTYGQSLPIRRRAGAYTRPKAVQHAGLGHKLMLEAEKIAAKKGYHKIAVISGIGVRDYYRKMGYRLENTYMIKKGSG